MIAGAPGMSSLHELSAAQMSALYRAGSASPVEVVTQVIAHIERWEPRLCALYAFDPEAALQAARESQARWHQGAPR